MAIALIVAVLIFVVLLLIAWIGRLFGDVPTQPASHNHSATETHKNYFSTFNVALSEGWNQIGMFIKRYREEIVAVGTLFIALFTIVLAFATGFLYVATRNLVKDAEKTSERQLRAYVDIADIGASFVPISEQDKRAVPVGTVIIKNFGQTPANKVTVSARTIIREYPLGTSPLPLRAKNPKIETRFAPGAQMPVNIPAEEKIATDDQIAAWNNETVAIYFYGTITYEDIFERACTVNFRVLHSVTDKSTTRFALEGNSIECSKK